MGNRPATNPQARSFAPTAAGYGNDETVARALELGAADYIVKPFSPTEVVAPIRSALRRRDRPGAFALGELRVRYDQRRVTVAGEPVAQGPFRTAERQGTGSRTRFAPTNAGLGGESGCSGGGLSPLR